MLLAVVVDRELDAALADRVADVLMAWADDAARRVGAERGLEVQQIDSGAFADDTGSRPGWSGPASRRSAPGGRCPGR